MTNDEKNVFKEAVGKLAFLIASSKGSRKGYSVLSPGDVASLRRMDISNPTAVFWNLMAEYVPEILRSGEKKERNWALMCKAMAVMSPHVIDNSVTFGGALSMTGYASEDRLLRLNRLLRAEGESFEDYFLSACQFLKAKAQGINWKTTAFLVIYQNDDARKSLARDFFAKPKSDVAA